MRGRMLTEQWIDLKRRAQRESQARKALAERRAHAQHVEGERALIREAEARGVTIEQVRAEKNAAAALEAQKDLERRADERRRLEAARLEVLRIQREAAQRRRKAVVEKIDAVLPSSGGSGRVSAGIPKNESPLARLQGLFRRDKKNT